MFLFANRGVIMRRGVNYMGDVQSLEQIDFTLRVVEYFLKTMIGKFIFSELRPKHNNKHDT